MRKFVFLMLIGFVLTSCTKSELEEVSLKYEEVSSVNNKKKEDVNFRIFKDRTQSGKSDSK